jgi:hypothetical protein
MNTTQLGPVHASAGKRRGLASKHAGHAAAIGLSLAGLLIGVALPAQAEGDAAAGRKIYQNSA